MNSTQEIRLARELVNAGLLKAAESFSFFMKEKMDLNKVDCNFEKSNSFENLITKQGDDIHMLITEVIGELKGVCCLLFSSEEAEKLRQVALPAEILNNPQVMAEMSDGILLEVDNIISASVITTFSNVLLKKMYGGVPAIRKVNNKEIQEYIQTKLEQDMLIVSFNTHFVSPLLDFSPQFIWLFDRSFSDSIQKHISESSAQTN